MNTQGNSSSGCPQELPPAYAYISALPLVYKIIFVICGAITFIMVIMYIETVVFYFKRLYNWKPKDKAKWVLAVYPIFGITSFVSLIVPRSSNVNGLVATCYLAVCIYQFVTMLIGHYGGAKLMAKKLSGSNFNLNTGPCCCCCRCLPEPTVTRKHIHTVQSLVIQYALLGPALSYSMAIVWADDDVYSNPFTNPSTYMNLLNTVASLVALWGMSITFHFSAPMLQHTHVKPKFLCMQLLSVFHNIQSLIFNILTMSDVFECEHMLNSVAVGLRYHNIILTVEVFALWCIARHYYRDIGDFPQEEQVYVDTCNMATNMSGTLLKDLEITSNVSSSIYGPTCARDIMKEEAMFRAMTMVRTSPVSFMLDNSTQEVLMDRRLRLAESANDYESVQYRRDKKTEIGPDWAPPAKQARMTEGNVKTKINRGNFGKTDGGPNSPTGKAPAKRYRFAKRQSKEVLKVSAGIGPDEYLSDGVQTQQLRIRENPMDEHSESVPSGSRHSAPLGAISEDSTVTPSSEAQPLDSRVVPMREEPGRRVINSNMGTGQDSVPYHKEPLSTTAVAAPMQQQMQQQSPQLPQFRQLPPGQQQLRGPPDNRYDAFDENQNHSRMQSPRPPSVASSTTSKASNRPFILLQSPNQSMDEGSRPPSTVPPARAARRAKRAAKGAGLNQAGQPKSSPAGSHSAFQPVQQQASSQPGSQQSPVSPDQVRVRIDSSV